MIIRHTSNLRRSLQRRILTIVIALTLLVIVSILIRPTTLKTAVQSNLTPPTISSITTHKQQFDVGLPTRLQIPSIHVDAVVSYSGLTSDGAMDIKENPDEVAWYQFGPRPGDIGSAVIAGHYGWSDKKASVFNELHMLNKDDKISVVDSKGTSTTFIVRYSQKYDPKADASSVFESYDGKSHLNLITCDGVWNNDKQTYSDRLVIFTDKETK